MFRCTVCDEILEPHQCVFSADERNCEVYICCPRCGGECGSYDGEEDEEDEWDGEEDEGNEEEDEGGRVGR